MQDFYRLERSKQQVTDANSEAGNEEDLCGMRIHVGWCQFYESLQFHRLTKADSKQVVKAVKRQCYDAYQRQHHNPRHQRHPYTVLVDDNFSTDQKEKIGTHLNLIETIAEPTNPLSLLQKVNEKMRFPYSNRSNHLTCVRKPDLERQLYRQN